MFSENQVKQDDNKTKELPDFDNLVAFYDLALKVHKRIHPELYQYDTPQQTND